MTENTTDPLRILAMQKNKDDPSQKGLRPMDLKEGPMEDTIGEKRTVNR